MNYNKSFKVFNRTTTLIIGYDPEIHGDCSNYRVFRFFNLLVSSFKV